MVASCLVRRSQVSKSYLADPNRTHCAAPLSCSRRPPQKRRLRKVSTAPPYVNVFSCAHICLSDVM